MSLSTSTIPPSATKGPSTMSTLDVIKVCLSCEGRKVLTLCYDLSNLCTATNAEVEDVSLGALNDHMLKHSNRSNLISKKIKSKL